MKNKPHEILILLTAMVSIGGASLARVQAAPSEETTQFFRLNCASCHTIGGGPLTGPDLKGATERREEGWLIDFILDPKGVIDSGDAYAVELLREARGVYMTPTPGMTRELATKLVRLMEVESQQERSQFAGLQISDRPLTEADVARGKELFLGRAAYANGSPSCISCHAVNGIGGLGGGRLGPDLSDVYSRLEGRKALSAWLSAPPSLVMQPVYAKHALEGEEVLALVAYLKDVAEAGEADAPASTLEFLLAGFAGSVVLLLLFDFLWRRRYRATRRPLVSRARRHAAAGTHS